MNRPKKTYEPMGGGPFEEKLLFPPVGTGGQRRRTCGVCKQEEELTYVQGAGTKPRCGCQDAAASAKPATASGGYFLSHADGSSRVGIYALWDIVVRNCGPTPFSPIEKPAPDGYINLRKRVFVFASLEQAVAAKHFVLGFTQAKVQSNPLGWTGTDDIQIHEYVAT